MSAQGSEQFTWKRFPGIPRECGACGRKLRVEDVGEYRTTYVNGTALPTVVWCVDHRGGRPETARQVGRIA